MTARLRPASDPCPVSCVSHLGRPVTAAPHPTSRSATPANVGRRKPLTCPDPQTSCEKQSPIVSIVWVVTSSKPKARRGGTGLAMLAAEGAATGSWSRCFACSASGHYHRTADARTMSTLTWRRTSRGYVHSTKPRDLILPQVLHSTSWCGSKYNYATAPSVYFLVWFGQRLSLVFYDTHNEDLVELNLGLGTSLVELQAASPLDTLDL